MNEQVAYDPQTEAFMLCAIFDEPSRIWEVRQIVRASDFAVPRAASVYSIMCALADEGITVSPITVNDLKIAAGRAHEFTDEYTHEVNGLDARGYQAMVYAEIVRKHGERRKLHEVAQRIMALAASGDNAEGDLVERASGFIDDLRDGALRQAKSIGEVFRDVLAKLKTEIPYVPTPWPPLNSMIGGIRRGSLYTVAARSGGGKSILALQLAQHIAEMGHRVGYISLEMNQEELVKRLVSMMRGIHQAGVQNHQLTDAGYESFAAAEEAVERLPLELHHRPNMQWGDIVSLARALHRKGDLRLIVIDYLGLVPSPPGSRNRPQDLTDWANGGKQLAQELDCSVLILEQLNRNVTNRPSPRPLITDLKGSSGLENASDAVVLMHRGEKKVGGKVEMTSDVDFIIAKNRQGESGSRTLKFQGEFARIVQKHQENTALMEPGEV